MYYIVVIAIISIYTVACTDILKTKKTHSLSSVTCCLLKTRQAQGINSAQRQQRVIHDGTA